MDIDNEEKPGQRRQNRCTEYPVCSDCVLYTQEVLFWEKILIFQSLTSGPVGFEPIR